ncbi:MAG: SipW-dependent-type signal peptide-containing protein [Acidimicrobiales bacterium]
MKKNRRWLYLLLAGGLIAIGAGGGTFATFNAQVSNKNNTFSTGTLTLKEGSATTCKSTASTTNSGPTTKCAALLTVATSPGLAPGAVLDDSLTVTNGGTLTATNLSVFATGACANTARTLGAVTRGTLCTKLDFFIEETAQTGTATYTDCWYGCTSTKSVISLTLKTAHTEGTATTTQTVTKLTKAITVGKKISLTTGSHSQVVTVKTAAAKTATSITVTSVTPNYSYGKTSTVVDVSGLAGTSVKTFCTTETTAAPLSLLALSATATTTKAIPALKASKSRTFLVGLYLPTTTTAQNTLQDVSAKFSLTWKITQ